MIAHNPIDWSFDMITCFDISFGAHISCGMTCQPPTTMVSRQVPLPLFGGPQLPNGPPPAEVTIDPSTGLLVVRAWLDYMSLCTIFVVLDNFDLLEKTWAEA